jgi:hypothetical protein
LLTRFKTVNPAFLASLNETVRGVLNVEKTLRTGRRQEGQTFRGAASRGRRNVKWPPHTTQPPSHNSYSYSGIAPILIPDAASDCERFQLPEALRVLPRGAGWQFGVGAGCNSPQMDDIRTEKAIY